MRYRNIRVLPFFAMAIFLFTCSCNKKRDSRNMYTDVSLAQDYNFKSFSGNKYRTKVEVAIAKIKTHSGETIEVIIPQDAYDDKHPEYNPPPFLEKVVAKLPIGFTIRIHALLKENGIAGLLRVQVSLEDDIDASSKGKVVYIDRTMLTKNKFMYPSSPANEWTVDSKLLEHVK